MVDIIGDPDELITAVQHESRITARKIVEEAEKRAEQIRIDARNRAEEEAERIAGQARGRAKQARKDRRLERTREKKESYLKTRQEMMNRVWRRAEQKLAELVDDEASYLDVLERLALDAARVMGPGNRVLTSDETGHRLLGEERLKQWAEKAEEMLGGPVDFRRSDAPADISGGLMVEDEDGRRRVNADFSVRLAAAEEEIAHRVMERLVRDE